MRVVVFSNADSVWCKEYIEYVLSGQYEVLLISGVNKKYRRFYREKGVKVLCMNFSAGNTAYVSGKLASQVHRDDIFHIHYVNPKILKYVFLSWLKCKRRILTYWGSDILRASTKQIYFTLPFIYTANEITVINNDMYEKLKSYVIRSKWNCIRCLDFGVPTFRDIDELEKQTMVSECKSHFGMAADKTIVAVGYNSRREQQHLEMMREVVKLPENILSGMIFLFHFSYGDKDNSYIRQLEKFLKNHQIQYKIIWKFLDKKEIAILRLSTDIFLYGQITDGFSASVMECLYAGAVLIKPRWLDYSEYDELVYYEYDKLKEISGILSKITEDGICRMQCNKKQLREKNSWETLAAEWKKLYADNSKEK